MAKRHTEKELPSILYKYRRWDNDFHRKTIKCQEVYLARPSQYNDPFDCRIPFRADLLSEEERNNKNIELLRFKYKDEEEVRTLAKHLRDTKQMWFDPRAGKERKEQLDKWDEISGVFGLSEVNDNILMWSHYANCHQGFVVGFWSSALMQMEEFTHLDYVNYTLDFPLISALDTTNAQFYKKFFYKAEPWSYEKEWRMVTLHKKNRVVKLEKSAIAEVVLGSRMSEIEENAIRVSLKKYLPNVKLFKAEVSTEKFVLQLNPIET